MVDHLRKSLRTRIILSAGVGLALVLGLMTLQSVRVLNSTTQQLLAEWRITVEQSAGHLQTRVEEDELLADTLAASGNGAAADLVSTWSRLAVFRTGLFWVDAQSQVMARVPQQEDPAQLLPAPLADALPPPGATRRLSGLLHTARGWPVITYAVRTASGGTLLAVGDLQSGFLDSYLPLPAGGGHAVVADAHNWVLASNVPSLRFTQHEHPIWLANVARGGKPVVGETIAQGPGEPHIMAFAPVGDTGWGVLFGEPASAALAAREELMHRLLFLGLLAVVMVMGYAWYDTGAVTRPLQRLTELAGRIAAGDLETPVQMYGRKDEVGALAQSFETMRLHLRESVAERNQALAETRRRQEESAAMYEVSRDILQPEGGDALRTIVERARELLGGRSAAICLADVPGGPLRTVAVTPPEQAEHSESGSPCSAPGSVVESIHPGPLLRPEQAGDPAIAPIVAESGPTGRLCVVGPAGGGITADGQRLLAGLADLAALALTHKRLQEQAQELAVYAERERIARDLHDTVSQSLSYLYSQLELLIELLPGMDGAQLSQELRALSGVASVAFESARESIYSLRGSGGRDPLPSAIAGCVRDFTARTGVAVDLDTEALPQGTLSAEVESQLVRIVQEALSNVARHSRASRVAVQAVAQDGALQVTIEDNGVGFEPGAPRQGRRSFGLEMMRERAETVGGSFDISTCRGHGTRIRVSIPLQSKEMSRHAEDPRATG